MKKFLLSLLCVFGLAATSHAVTKTYQLCTDETEILNPDNQFILVSSKLISNGVSAATNNVKGSAITVISSASSIPETLVIDAEQLGLGIFSVKANGSYKALYESTNQKYWGLRDNTTPQTDANLYSTDTQYQLNINFNEDYTVKITSQSCSTRWFQFNSIYFRAYVSGNSNYSPLFYKEVEVGAIKPSYSNFQENYTLEIGESMNVPAIRPSELTYSFTTVDNTIVKVENNIITSLAEGQATIKFTTAAVEDKFEEGEGSFTVTVTKIKPQLRFRDQVVYGKLGKGVVWEPVIVTDPEDPELRGEITYSSSDPEIVEIDANSGQIYPEGVKAAGTVKITADMKEKDNYGAGSASYTVIIVDPDDVNVAPTLSSFDFTTYDAETGKGAYGMTPQSGTSATYEKEVTEIHDLNKLVTISFDDAIGNPKNSTHRIWEKNSTYELRISKKGKFTIAVPEGYKISKIGFVGGQFAATSVPENKLPSGTDKWDDVEGVSGSDLKFDWLPKTTEPVNSVTFTNTETANITNIYVLYELASSNLKSADLSFDKVINSIYENEEAVLNAVENPNNLEITYGIANLDESAYTITPAADGKTIKVLVKKPGYYSLEAKSAAQGDYRDGFAIMRVNVYRHLNVYVDLSEDMIEEDKIDTNGKDEATIITMAVPELTNLYYKIVPANQAATQAEGVETEEDDENCIKGFTLYEDQIDVPAGTHGNLVFYIAAYGYFSPQRTISLDGLARLVEEGKLIKLTHNNVLGQLHVEYAFSLENHNGTEPEISLQVFDMVGEVTDFAPVENPATVHAVIARAASHAYNGKLTFAGDGLLDPMRCGHLSAVLTAKVGDQEVKVHEAQLAGEIQTGIENVAVDAAADAEFFTLEGIRVSEPAAGQFYIKRQGGKAVKVLVK